jgi:hypothetical protein|tara:strand:+ start:680 stop:913 length:234 start_codon:yes stop_codon:yes gene_type:complete
MKYDFIKEMWDDAEYGFKDQRCDPEVIVLFAKIVAQRCVDLLDDGDGGMSSMSEHVWRQSCCEDIRGTFKLHKEEDK